LSQSSMSACSALMSENVSSHKPKEPMTLTVGH
jgi:hypothetical protein